MPLRRHHWIEYFNNQQDVFMLHINSCQGASPGPLESGEGKHGEATARRVGAAAAHDRRAGDGAEAAELRERAQAARLSMGAYLRRRALGQRVRSAVERRLGAAELRELNRIGVNLNQMARAMNSGAVSSPAETQEAVERVGELVAKLLAGERE